MPRRHQLVLRVFSSSSHSWQAGQRQRRSASLNRGRRCASQSRPSTGRCMHQQAVNACPACCAHWLGWPHSGHCKTRSFACAEAGLVLLAQEVLAGMAKRGQRRLLRNREHGFKMRLPCGKRAAEQQPMSSGYCWPRMLAPHKGFRAGFRAPITRSRSDQPCAGSLLKDLPRAQTLPATAASNLFADLLRHAASACTAQADPWPCVLRTHQPHINKWHQQARSGRRKQKLPAPRPHICGVVPSCARQRA